ncbi:MAG: hypothetical protein Q7J57_01490 [Gemmobacter sp.]|nr:hypothetical protein [Gemmobacter sp.]
MPIHDLISSNGAMAFARMRSDDSSWLTRLDALSDDCRAIGLVWSGAPDVADLAAMASATLGRGRAGYLDRNPVVLPWQSIAANLVLGTDTGSDGAMAAQVLSVVGLSARGPRRPQGLAPFQVLALGLGRAMLQNPGLLIIAGLHRHPAAVGQLRALTRIEAELGALTGCRRLHVVDRLPDAETFCDTFLQLSP